MAFTREQKKQHYINNRDAYRARAKESGHSHKVQTIMHKNGVCSMCGVKYDGTNACIFQFHHIDPSQKEFEIGSRSFADIENIMSELNKCIMVCANCHTKIHSEEY